MIEYMKLHPKAKIPLRKTQGAAGFDIFYTGENARPVTLNHGERFKFNTGIACAIPLKWCGIIMPRSGLADDCGIDKLAGLIDDDYRGELKIILINHGRQPIAFDVGDRIAQLTVTPYMGESKEVTTLSETVRGSGGFGSTGSA